MAEKKKADNQGKEIFQCTGALMLFRPEFFEHCGLLDDSFVPLGRGSGIGSSARRSRR